MNILVYGDSNAWAQEPSLNTYTKDAQLSQYPQEKTWWNVLTNEHNVYVNGLCGRAISQKNPYIENSKALDTIYSDFQSLPKMNLIILQLGTNDMKSKYNMSASEISLSLETLVDTIRNIISCENIMIISPPYIRSGTPTTDKHYIGANYKSVEVDKYYKQLAQTKKLIFVSGLQAQTGIDGEHLSIQGHQYLAKRVKSKVDQLISTDQPNQ